jgi:hypothetical protein
MKSLLSLLGCVYADILATRSYVGADRDILYITARVKKEGLSFLTITLPTFAKDFERSLSEGCISPTLFRSFRKNGVIPRLFSGILERIFDTDGKLLLSPSIDAISDCRQLCLLFKKYRAECSSDRVKSTFDSYRSIEQELAHVKVDLRAFKKVAGQLWSVVFSDFSVDNLTPSHGPGAVAEKFDHDVRRNWTYWHQRLEGFFPYYSTAAPIGAIVDNLADSVKFLSAEEEQPVRVVTVPKTLKGPRIIAIEPAAMQYCQQSMMRYLVNRLERHPLTKDFVRFSDQTINQQITSRWQEIATLDLKDASDRVHGGLVWEMLSSIPLLRDAIFACRSTKAALPSGEIITLQKFASMGSALCFPIESMVFFTILILEYMESEAISRVSEACSRLAGSAGVYGDDIYCPINLCQPLIARLESFGLKVNRDKSFWTGKFRESCGVDTYDGQAVTALYLKYGTSQGDDPERDVSNVTLANALFDKGYVRSAWYVAEHMVRRKFNHVSSTKYIGYIFPVAQSRERWNTDLQRREQLTHVVVPRTRRFNLDGWYALSDWFAKRSFSMLSQRKVVLKNASFKLKRHWSPLQ